MTRLVRAATPEDAAGIARVWATSLPYLVRTARAIEARLRVPTAARGNLVAVEDDHVAGFATIWMPKPGAEAPRLRVTVQVAPDERGRGVGTELAGEVERQASGIGAGGVLGVVADDDASKSFATRRGYTLLREMSHAAADLAGVPGPAPVPAGMRLTDYREVDPVALHTAYEATAGGDPSGLSPSGTYQEWAVAEWSSPDLRKDLSMVLLDGDRIASFTTTTADPDRGVTWSNATGTVPEYRGRGLAKVVKSAALTRSREAGFVTAFTGNDANNLPMLAVNRWLGYRSAATAWTAEKVL